MPSEDIVDPKVESLVSRFQPRMRDYPRKCKICLSPDVVEINRRLIHHEIRPRELGKQMNMSLSSVKGHIYIHLQNRADHRTLLERQKIKPFPPFFHNPVIKRYQFLIDDMIFMRLKALDGENYKEVFKIDREIHALAAAMEAARKEVPPKPKQNKDPLADELTDEQKTEMAQVK